MVLTSPDEFIRLIGGVLRSALAQPAVAELLTRPASFRFGVVDPDCVLYIDGPNREVRFGSAQDLPTGMVAMNGDTAVAICQGRTDVASAMARGEVVAEGEVEALLVLLSASAGLPSLYADVARREGRVDLIAS